MHINNVCFCGSRGSFPGPDGENTLCKEDYKRYKKMASQSPDYASQLFTMQPPKASSQRKFAFSQPPSDNLMKTDADSLHKFINLHTPPIQNSESTQREREEEILNLLNSSGDNCNFQQSTEINQKADVFHSNNSIKIPFGVRVSGSSEPTTDCPRPFIASQHSFHPTYDQTFPSASQENAYNYPYNAQQPSYQNYIPIGVRISGPSAPTTDCSRPFTASEYSSQPTGNQAFPASQNTSYHPYNAQQPPQQNSTPY